MDLDQSTLAAVVGIKSIIGSGIFYLLHVSALRIPGTWPWTAASLAVGLAVLFDAFAIIDNPQLASLFFNMLLVSGQVLYLSGTAQFVGRPFARHTVLLLLALTAGLTMTSTLMSTDSVSRVLALTPIYVGANGWMAWLLWKHGKSHTRFAYGIAAVIMLVQAAAAAMQAVLAVEAHGMSFLSAAWDFPVSLVIWINAILTIVIGSWVLFLLIMLHLVDELKAMAEKGERERIARELHDTVLQTFQGFVLKANAILPECESALGSSLSRCLGDAINAIQEGREKIATLRAGPDHLLSLHEYLRMAGEQAAMPGQQFALRCEGMVRALNPIVRHELCAIGREALCNAFRHAHARQHEVLVEYGLRALILTIRDNGRGIGIGDREKPGHWGLNGIEERARIIHADATLYSAPGAGTRWHIEIEAALAYADARLPSTFAVCSVKPTAPTT